MMEMPHRRLGRSGLAVSRLALGTMMFGGRTDEAEAGRIIAAAAEAGVNFIDTAGVYAEGRSEEIIGRAIAADRPLWVLANPIVTGAIVGPRTLAQWQSYLGALDVALTEEDERAVDGLVPAGTTAVHQLVDPRYPVEGRPSRQAS